MKFLSLRPIPFPPKILIFPPESPCRCNGPRANVERKKIKSSKPNSSIVISSRKEFQPYTPNIIITFVLRNSFENVPGIHWYYLLGVLVWCARTFTANKERTLTSSVALRRRSERNVPTNGEPRVGFFFMTMFQHTGRFGQGFLSKEKRDNTAAPLILSWFGSGWFSPVPSTEMSAKGTALLWCDWH